MRRARHNIRGERMIDLFAEALSENGGIALVAKSMGISREYGRTMFKRIRHELGGQAQ